MAGSLLLGLALDTALHGAFLTYDYVWQAGIIPLALTLLLLVGQWTTLRAIQSNIPLQNAGVDAPFTKLWPWLAIGPFLFLKLLILQNIAHLSALTGWPLPAAFCWILICHLAGLGLAMAVRAEWLMLLGFVGVFQIVLLPWVGEPPQFGAAPPLAVALVFLVAQASLAGLMSLILARLTGVETRPGLRQMTLVHGLSMLLLVIFIFGFFIAFSLTVPYQNVWLFGLGRPADFDRRRQRRPTLAAHAGPARFVLPWIATASCATGTVGTLVIALPHARRGRPGAGDHLQYSQRI